MGCGERGVLPKTCAWRGEGGDKGRCCPVPSPVCAAGRGQGRCPAPPWVAAVPIEPCPAPIHRPSSSSQFNIPVHHPSSSPQCPPCTPPSASPRPSCPPPQCIPPTSAAGNAPGAAPGSHRDSPAPSLPPPAQPQGAPPAPLPSPEPGGFGSVLGVLAAAPGTGGTGAGRGDKIGGLEGGRVGSGPGFARRTSVWQCRPQASGWGAGAPWGAQGHPGVGGWGWRTPREEGTVPTALPSEPAKSRARHCPTNIPGGKKGGHKAQRPPQTSPPG